MFALARKTNFATYLRDARIKRRLTVAEVAEQVGVSGPCVYYWKWVGQDHGSALCKTLSLPIRATRGMAAAG